MISRVLISKKLLASFRRIVLEAYPNETMQTLWGRVEGDTVLISALKTPVQEQKLDRIDYQFSDVIEPQTGLRGEYYLGTIHSHPDCSDATPSMHDWSTSYTSGERIFGIMRCERKANGKFTTEIAWWEPRPAIVTVHPRVRDARNNKPKAESESVQVFQELSGEANAPVPVHAMHAKVRVGSDSEE